MQVIKFALSTVVYYLHWSVAYLLGVGRRGRGLHGCAVQRYIVQTAEVDLAGAAALLQRHIGVAWNTPFKYVTTYQRYGSKH